MFRSLLLLFFLPCLIHAHCYFIPPPKWEIADPQMLSKRTIIGFLDKRKSGFCPSINLTKERVTIPMEEYLSIVQKNSQAKKQRWQRLGTMQTKAGPAQLIEIETKTKYGVARLLQAIVIKNETAYILTAGTLKKEFKKQAKPFQQAIESLTFCEDLFDAVQDMKIKQALQEAWQKKQSGVDLNSFEEIVLKQCTSLGTVWQVLMLQL